MPGQWVNDESQNDTGNCTAESKLHSVSAYLTEVGTVILSCLVGSHYGSIIIGIAAYLVLTFLHVIFTIVLMDKDDIATMIRLKETKEDDEKLKNLYEKTMRSHSLESLAFVGLAYLALKVMIGI